MSLPSLPILKKSLHFLTLITAITVYIFDLSSKAANLALIALTITIFARPVVSLFPQIPLIKYLMTLRRQIGIASGIFALTHVLLVSNQFGGPIVLAQTIINLGIGSSLFFGSLALLVMITLLITSNDYSIRLLKRNWKNLHQLVHLLFILVLIHRGLREGQFAIFQAIILIIILYVLRYLSYKKSRAIIS